MNLNASIIDQRLEGLAREIQVQAAAELGIRKEGQLKPLAFLYLCVKTALDLDHQATFDCLTEGGGDFGVDALHLTDEADGEFVVTLFQAKYKEKLDGEAHFPLNGVETLIRSVQHLFDPSSDLGGINARLRAKVEEARALVRDGYIPKVQVIACNNGQRWNVDGDTAIARADLGSQVSWDYMNHDKIVSMLRRLRPANEVLELVGPAIFEHLNYSSVCIGRLPVTELARLMSDHGDALLERNIRRYLGLHGNRINEGIRSTLLSDTPSNFYFFNNGITFVCSDFNYSTLQRESHRVRVKDLQIVNGGQTSVTILKVAEELAARGEQLPAEASVLVRLYKLPMEDEDLVLQITHATNSQNPVDLKDLRANDEQQKQLEESIQGLGFVYRRKRAETATSPTEITSGVTAEAVLSVWRHAPHQAKFLTREHFGKLYETIFSGLNGAQAVLAVLLYRIAENRRRRPHAEDPPLVRYASCFIAMQMGRRLLRDLHIQNAAELSHRNFEQAQRLVEENGDTYFRHSVADVENAAKALYGGQEISLQQLSATFRRGDLIQTLLEMDIDDAPM